MKGARLEQHTRWAKQRASIPKIRRPLHVRGDKQAAKRTAVVLSHGDAIAEQSIHQWRPQYTPTLQVVSEWSVRAEQAILLIPEQRGNGGCWVCIGRCAEQFV